MTEIDPAPRRAAPTSSRGRVLVVEDDAPSRAGLCALLAQQGYSVDSAADGFKALQKLDPFGPELVITDLQLPGMDGIELLGRVQEWDRDCPVIILTGSPMVESAVTALKQGALDYLTKPLIPEQLLLSVGRALEHRELRLLRARLRQREAEDRGLQNIVGDSAAMRGVIDAVETIAPSRATVLLTGESGTGKELVAAAIHERGPRAAGPLVKVNCAALSEGVLESELFGHERGAFTGAERRRQGLFEQAHGGTLFLDEIGEISAAMQVRLLRLLQDHEFSRVGGDHPIRVDVRVIAATNRDLRRAVSEGRFREDLYYRLNVLAIELPPLRDRPGDIPLIAAHVLRRIARQEGRAPAGFSDEALRLLLRYHWPGNVRELANAVERAAIVCTSEHIGPGDLPSWVRAAEQAPALPLRAGPPPIPGARMDEVERYVILKTLEHTGGSTTQAAEILGLSVRTIQYRLQSYQMSSRRGRGPRVGLFGPKGPSPSSERRSSG